MNYKWLFPTTILFCLVSTTAYSDKANNVVIGKTVALQSTILQKEITLSIHVPENHAKSTGRYPVLYMFQTHFEQVAGAVKNLYDYSLIPEMMVVRIDNYEFGYLTPTVITGKPNSGQADKFLEFFEEELFPFVDSRYRTYPYRIVFSKSRLSLLVRRILCVASASMTYISLLPSASDT